MKLREADLKYLMASADPGVHLPPGVAAMAEAIAAKYESKEGARDGWLSDELDWRAIRETAVKNPGLLKEAHGGTAFGQLLRAGIQLIANTWYKRAAPTYREIAIDSPSNKRQEFHAPLFGSAFPRKVGAGEPFRESQVVGQDIEIVNLKFGQIEAFDRELFDDDQTGQIANRAQKLGEAMPQLEEAYFTRRFIGAASVDLLPDEVPASKWSGVNKDGTAITTPFSVNMYEAAIGNRPAAFGQLSFFSLMDGYNSLRRAKDPLGVIIPMKIDYLLISPFDELNAKTLLTSEKMPATPGLDGETVTTASSGFFRGAFSENPFRGAMKPVINPYFAWGGWAIGQAKTGYVNQMRDPMEVTQEMPSTGQNFENDNYRFRSRERFEQEWVDPRFHYLGNDGTAALSQ